MHHEENLSEEMRQAAQDPAALARQEELEMIRKNLEDYQQDLAEKAKEQELGPTGQFPEGQLTENDEGEIRIAVGALKGAVVINFGRPIASLGLNPHQAKQMANSLWNTAIQLEKDGRMEARLAREEKIRGRKRHGG